MSQQHYQKLFQKLQSHLPGNATPWITQLRTEAFAAFSEHGFPTTHDEAWKYTSLRAFAQKDFQTNLLEHAQIPKYESPRLDRGVHKTHAMDPADKPRDVGERKVLLPQDGENTLRLVFIDGQFVPEQSSVLQDSIQLLAPSMNDNAEILKPFLNQSYPSPNARSHAFLALNTAFMQNGAFIQVPTAENITIHLVFKSTEKQAEKACHWRNIIVLPENTSATVLEHYCGPDDISYLTNTCTEIFLGENAKLTHYKLQNEGLKAFHFGQIYVGQSGKNSQFSNHTISLGGHLSRSDIEVALKAPQTHCLLNGLYQLSDTQHADHHTTIDHQVSHGNSQEFYKGILDEQARGVFNGKVLVRQGAQKTDSKQYNHNLLLSLDAQINTKPQLEILADDVKCVHGATVGQLDDTALFYLRSRGLDEKTAQQLLRHAFFNDIIERIPDAFFQEQVKQCL